MTPQTPTEENKSVARSTRITPAQARRMGFMIESEFNIITKSVCWTISVEGTDYEVAYSSRSRKAALENLRLNIQHGEIVLHECWICEKEFFKQESICCNKCNEHLPPCS